ncbi:TMhelix containing protein [Vibrio phage 1.170.O._10N.261.52.C3]|nr:TMhelix containing protein [Vibrio phage 1.170.O._10N.261.52.C3]
MLPFIFPLILIMYGEYSSDLNIRYVSRCILYSYALSFIFPFYLDDHTFSIMAGAAIFLSGLVYATIFCESNLSRFSFIMAGVIASANYATIILQDYYLLQFPLYATYSNTVMRDLILAGIAYLNYTKTFDRKLDFITIVLMGIEFL